MKTKQKIEAFEHFILRSPLLPLDFLNHLLVKDNLSVEELQQVCQKKEILEAIFLASPNLHSKIVLWLRGELKDKKEANNLPYSVYKYLARMASRCTPFGLFAGNSVGTIGNTTNTQIPPIDQYRRTTRLDMNYLCSLSQDLSKDPLIRKTSSFFPNTSIYEYGSQLRYVEYFYKNARRTHHITAVDHSEYLQNILEMAKNGASVQKLAEVIVDEEISLEEATEFITELIDNQLLISEIEPSVTGNGLLENSIAFLEENGNMAERQSILSQVEQKLKAIDVKSPGIDPADYHTVADNLKPLGTDYELKYLFQADMVKPVKELAITQDVIKDIKEGIDILNKFTAKSSENNLSKFKDAFYKKYEDAEIPLLQALDTESGVGFVQSSGGTGDYSPLIDDIELSGKNSGSMQFEWSAISSFLFKKYLASIKENKYTIEITSKEIEKLNIADDKLENLPVTLSAMVQLFRNDDKLKVVMSSAGGSSAANLLGRFCHTDRQILDHVKEIVKKEEEYYPDQIIAEIVHLPESRTGNILHRPVLRKYEIPYLANASVEQEFQILPEDLMVSIKYNKIILRSKQLNKEIIPRLTSAHNFSYNALPIYQFLCEMQTQDLKGGVGFNWGPLANQYPFLPRVCYKNLIFSLASWNILKDDFEKFTKIKDDATLLSEVIKWKNLLKMPEWVALEDGDNELIIKLSNLLSIKTLISLVKNRPNFKLVEFIANNENMIVKSDEGLFTNEFIFSFYKN